MTTVTEDRMKTTWPLFVPLLALFACSKGGPPTAETFQKPLLSYLEQRGDLCLGKASWPVGVTDGEAQRGSRNAVQMPVLERLGIVEGAPAVFERPGDDGATVREAGRRYTLTAEGKKYHVTRDTNQRDADGRRVRESDFCPVKLDLNRITNVDIDESRSGRATVAYTYRVTAPDWARTPDVQRVFPAVARVIAGAGTATLVESFALTKDGWTAVDLVDEPQALAQKAP